jgi:hypothetical protein
MKARSGLMVIVPTRASSGRGDGRGAQSLLRDDLDEPGSR